MPEPIFNCFECKGFPKIRESDLRAHFSAIHLGYFPIGCGHCLGKGVSCWVATEHKLQVHTRIKHPDMTVETREDPDEEKEARLDDLLAECRKAMKVPDAKTLEKLPTPTCKFVKKSPKEKPVRKRPAKPSPEKLEPVRKSARLKAVEVSAEATAVINAQKEKLLKGPPLLKEGPDITPYYELKTAPVSVRSKQRHTTTISNSDPPESTVSLIRKTPQISRKSHDSVRLSLPKAADGSTPSVVRLEPKSGVRGRSVILVTKQGQEELSVEKYSSRTDGQQPEERSNAEAPVVSLRVHDYGASVAPEPNEPEHQLQETTQAPVSDGAPDLIVEDGPTEIVGTEAGRIPMRTPEEIEKLSQRSEIRSLTQQSIDRVKSLAETPKDAPLAEHSIEYLRSLTHPSPVSPAPQLTPPPHTYLVVRKKPHQQEQPVLQKPSSVEIDHKTNELYVKKYYFVPTDRDGSGRKIKMGKYVPVEPKTKKAKGNPNYNPRKKVLEFECKSCQVGVTSGCTVAHVKVNHLSSGMYSCHYCDYRKGSRNQVKRHSLRVHKGQPYTYHIDDSPDLAEELREKHMECFGFDYRTAKCKCALCGNKCGYGSSMMSHSLTMHPQARKCMHCGSMHADSSTLNIHHTQMHPELRYNYRFLETSELYNACYPADTVAETLEQSPPRQDTCKMVVECHKCGTEHSVIGAGDHIFNHADFCGFSCPYCNLEHRRYDCVANHIKRKHPRRKVTVVSEKGLKGEYKRLFLESFGRDIVDCAYCDKSPCFMRLHKHVRQHLDDARSDFTFAQMAEWCFGHFVRVIA